MRIQTSRCRPSRTVRIRTLLGGLALARSRHVGSGATGAREPSQVRKEAALSGSAWVPPGRLICAASGPLRSIFMRLRPSALDEGHAPRALPRLRICAWLAPLRSLGSGGMRERPNRHAWKACVGQLTVGSNPTPSALGLAPASSRRFASARRQLSPTAAFSLPVLAPPRESRHAGAE